MKKFYRICFIALASIAMLSSCEKEDHAVNQKVTYYPVYSISGGSTVAWQVGTKWVDPGYSASLNGKDVTDQVVIYSDLDADTPGIYNIIYSLTNEDGFEGTTSRTVVVYDIANAGTADISGYYTDCTVIDLPDTEDEINYKSQCGYTMSITNGPGKGLFYVSDLFSGMWEFYREYGKAYAFKALIQLNMDNTISLLKVSVAWTYSCLPNGTSYYDPETGDVVINWYWDAWGDNLRTIYKR